MKLAPFLLLFVSSVLGLAACGGGTADVGGTPGGGTSPAPGGTSTATPATPAAPDPVVGIYHLSQVDATNLELRADGTYRWTIEGCDFGGGQCGYWKKALSGEVMLSAGDADLEWSWDGSFKQKMRWLSVTKTADGVRVVGETSSSQKVTQDWKTGRSCAVCGGNLGPTGQKECTEPLPEVCTSTR
jgi:hypothetical protein